jgi:hypothetical protein
MRLSSIANLAAAVLTWTCVSAAHAGEDDATTTYHADTARSGHYVVPGLTFASAGNIRLDASFDGRVQGQVYAQPLYWRPAGAASGQLIVATEDNVVAALDAATGHTLWRKTLGPPVERGKLPCGNIDPTLGITDTPVIDRRSGALYLDAMIAQAEGPQHMVFGLSLADGAVLPGWPVNTADALREIGESFDPSVQNQRGALTMVGDRLYVPYHGHYGACGEYHGWVVGLRLDKPAAFAAWRTSHKGGGNWAPGGIAFDGQYLFVGTGPNTDWNAHEWGGGESIIRLSPDLRWRSTPQDFFAISDRDWAHDLGGASPLPIDLSESGPHAAMLFTFAREGKACLLDRAELGGVDRPLVEQKVAGPDTIASPAAYRVGRDTMVAFQARGASCPGGAEDAGVVALRILGGPQPAMQTAWCAKLAGWHEATIVTTSDDAAEPIVWIVGAEGDDKLHGFRGDTGKPVYTSEALEGLRHFAAILPAEGRFYLAGDGRVISFILAR